MKTDEYIVWVVATAVILIFLAVLSTCARAATL
jgi:hypothetical protein